MRKIIVFSLVLALPLLFSGCFLTDMFAEKASEAVLESVSDMDVDLEEGEINITGEDGESISVGESLDLPSDFPSDVPIYDDANITSASSNSSLESHYLSLTSTDDYSDITSYYESELEDNGWTIDNTSTFTAQGKSTTYLCSKGDRDLSVGLFEYEGTTTITISVQKSE